MPIHENTNLDRAQDNMRRRIANRSQSVLFELVYEVKELSAFSVTETTCILRPSQVFLSVRFSFQQKG